MKARKRRSSAYSPAEKERGKRQANPLIKKKRGGKKKRPHEKGQGADCVSEWVITNAWIDKYGGGG